MLNLQPHPIWEVAARLLVVWLAVVWIAGAIYVAVSYVTSARYVPQRSLGTTVRWVLRECWSVLWTQPLMPLFQLFGQRLGSGRGVPIVLVHGYFQNRVDFLYLARRLGGAGLGPLYAFNFFWPQELEASSDQLSAFVARVRASTGAAKVDLLTHSTGGLFALDLIATQPDALRRVAVVAIPGRGVPWNGPLLGRSGSQLRMGSLYQAQRSNSVSGDVPVLSAFSLHDNVVHPAATSELAGTNVRNFAVEGPGHLSVLFDRRIADEVVGFLSGPEPPERTVPPV